MKLKGGDCVSGRVDSVEFAKYLNSRAVEMGIEPNVTKIHKWLYICYGTYLVLSNKQLLDESPMAWDYGPAFPRVYNTQKRNGKTLIGLPNRQPPESFKEYDELIDAVLGYFGSWTAGDLVNWTHERGSAWDKKYNMGRRYGEIDNHDIITDFNKILRKS